MAYPRRQGGFTLIEMIMVIVILGVIGGTVAVFIRKPVDAYLDTSRRAALSDLADTAVRRMARDIQRALPNSLRNPSSQCIEFIPTRTGARDRAETSATGTGDILDFTTADSSFGVYGNLATWPADQQVRAGDVVVVYNLGIGGANAYAGDNTSAVTAVTSGTESVVTIDAKQFPLASPNHRFQVIPGDEKIVSFVCNGGKLYRSSNHAYASSCPTTGAAVLADNVASCNFVYNDSDLQRNALVQLTMVLTDSQGDSASLYHEVHVSNTP